MIIVLFNIFLKCVLLNYVFFKFIFVKMIFGLKCNLYFDFFGFSFLF